MIKEKFTDLFIKRPVLATVISLLIFCIGLRAIFSLPVQQYPTIENTLITISTAYPGAPASLVEGFITSPIEKEIASADGIDYVTSSSQDGVSVISAYIRLNFNPDTAFTDISSKVSYVRNLLPEAAEDPLIVKKTGQSSSLMYLGFSSKSMSSEQITDYLSRVVQPKLETVPGVAEAAILGARTYAMRIWLNPDKMAAFGLSPNDVTAALQANNFQASAGALKNYYITAPIRVDTDLQTEKEFKALVVKESNGQLVRLEDIARVELGAEDYDSAVIFSGKKAVFMGISQTPSANPLTVISGVKKVFPEVQAAFPPSLTGRISFDTTVFIRASIQEVIQTILEATLIVIGVIFLFLGSLRTVLIPIITIPLSLVGVFGMMICLGYSINLLTLLALVLAIGLVVDDAIVVLENIYRHIEEGQTPLNAALAGAREIATPIITMTITLAAVYAPIGLMSGITGALFKEFAFTLASAVVISGVIALTLSPMMCAKLLKKDIGDQPLVKKIDALFNQLKVKYQRGLSIVLSMPTLVVTLAFVILSSCYFLLITSRSEMAPTEDQGIIFVMGKGPETATFNYLAQYADELNGIYKSFPSMQDYFMIMGYPSPSSFFSGFVMKPWGDRKESQSEVNAALQTKLNQVPGLRIQAVPLPSLPVGGKGLPIDFQITTISDFTALIKVTDAIVKEAKASGLFMFVNSTLSYDKTQLNVLLNRSKAAQMGIQMREVGTALGGLLSGAHVNYFSMEGRSYEVIPELADRFKDNPADLNAIHLRTASGEMIPLSTLATLVYRNQPNDLTHFQQLNAAAIEAMMAPGITMGQGLDYLEKTAKRLLPTGFMYDFGGESRQFKQEGNALLYTFFFSIIIIFLVLAAQFESFRDPLVIMLTVPMAICGALLPINWGLATLNIYTEIGLITLIGLITKHGILMVDFANHLRLENPALTLAEAIKEASAVRLRPILMTTLSMIFGVIPLLVAHGAGASSRFAIGLVIASGMTIGTLFTLYILPTIYTLRSRHIVLFLLSVATFILLVSQLIRLF